MRRLVPVWLPLVVLLGCPAEYHLRPETETSATTRAETETSAADQGTATGATATQENGAELGETPEQGEETAEGVDEDNSDEVEGGDEVAEGEEACPSEDGWERCDGSTCVHLENHEQHCGDCWNICRQGECVDGECLRDCDPDHEEDDPVCDIHRELCVEDDSDEAFCRCRPDLTNCGGVCRNLSNDPENCGDCGEICGPGESCIEIEDAYGERFAECEAIECEDDEDEHLDYCNGVCVDIEIDPLNCGECGHRCEASDLCFGGECYPVEYVPADECDACPCDWCEDDLPICCELDLDDVQVVCAEDHEEVEEFCDER